jgi:hypothetical protein
MRTGQHVEWHDKQFLDCAVCYPIGVIISTKYTHNNIFVTIKWSIHPYHIPVSVLTIKDHDNLWQWCGFHETFETPEVYNSHCQHCGGENH